MSQRRSFRDPAGFVISDGKRVLRGLRFEAAKTLSSFLGSAVARLLEERGLLIASRPVDDRLEGAALVLEHDRVAFPSYPHEWPAEMLHAAGGLTLDLAAILLDDSRCLKDATPLNILFRGTRPVFVDVASIEQRDARDAMWVAQAQFERTFILPLLVSRELGLSPARTFLAHRDGLEPAAVARMLGSLRRLKPRMLLPVTLPHLLGGRAKDSAEYGVRLVDSPERALFILRASLHRLRKQLKTFAPKKRRSAWTDYEAHATGADVKAAFTRRALSELKPRRVLDVGCNTGFYSMLAAESGSSVVAIDSDEAVVGALWREADQRKLDILPLVVDASRPSPALGWRNDEIPSFIERAGGTFDMVLMLALIHHLGISERVPLAEIAAFAAEMTNDALLVEWVGPDDPMAVHIARGRSELAARELSRDVFDSAFAAHFEVTGSVRTGTERMLFLMRKRS